MTPSAVAQQLPLELLIENAHALDRLDTWLALFSAKEQKLEAYSWMVRCYHATAAEALKEAHLVSPYIGTVYAIEFPIGDNWRQYWPHPTVWRNLAQAPFEGRSGLYWIARPNYHVVNGDMEYLVKGETPDERAVHEAMAAELFYQECPEMRPA